MLLVAALCTAGVALAPAGGPAGSGPPAARAAVTPGPVDRAVAALQAAQRSDGGFGTAAGASASDPSTSVWVALALEAVGVHPADQPGRGTTVLQYLQRRGAALADTGDLARLVLVLRAAGADGDLLATATTAKLVDRQRADGGWSDGATGPARTAASSFALLALSSATDDAGRAALGRGAAWLLAAHDGRGWGTASGAAARAGETGLALQALHAAQPDEFELTSAAQTFLNGAGNPDGGLGDARPSRSDAVATAFAMQGLRATGIDPATYRGLDGTTAGAFLTGRQRSDGSFGTTLGTARVLAGLNGVAFPLGTVARGSDRASAAAPKTARKNAAAGAATDGGAAALTGAQADGSGATASPGAGAASSSGAASSGASSGGAASSGATSSSGGAASSATPSAGASTPAAGAAATAAAASAPKASSGSSAKSDTPAADGGSAGSLVDGVVVGATRAAATTPAAAAAGGGGGGGTDPALLLAGAMAALAVAGAGLERRRPRTVLS